MGRPRLELVGMRSGRLTVISPADGPSGAGYYVMWECLCDCGNRVIKRSGSLKKGTSTSCGCLTKEKMSANAKTHGRSGTKTYWVWHNMKHRCSDTNHPSWSNYGERGIKVCDRWVNSVENFISDMGLRPAGMELDRIDPHGNYCVENCRWVSRKTNMNNKRNNHYLEFNGERLTLSQWGERTGINWNTIRRRVLAGWGVADSLTKPLMYQDRKKPVRAQGK